MRISDHYTPFTHKTLIVITNNERARILKAEDREVEEIETLETSDITTSDRHSEIDMDYDAMKAHRLKELYTMLGNRMQELTRHNGYEHIIACVPEVNKQQFMADMHTDIQKSIKELVPKNLCSMDLANIIRILMEG